MTTTAPMTDRERHIKADGLAKKLRAERSALLAGRTVALEIAVGDIQTFSDIMAPPGFKVTMSGYEGMRIVEDVGMDRDGAMVREIP